MENTSEVCISAFFDSVDNELYDICEEYEKTDEVCVSTFFNTSNDLELITNDSVIPAEQKLQTGGALKRVNESSERTAAKRVKYNEGASTSSAGRLEDNPTSPTELPMSKKKAYKYYVVELSYPIHNDEKFVCVPSSWIYNMEDQTAVVRYPRCTLDELMEKMKVDTYEEDAMDWVMRVVHVKLKTDSYKHAKSYMNYIHLNNKSRQTKSSDKSVEDIELLRSEGESTKSAPKIPSNSEYQDLDDDLFQVLSDDINETTNEGHNYEVETSDSISDFRLANDSTESTNSFSSIPKETQLSPSSAKYFDHNTRHDFDDSSDHEFEISVNSKRIGENNAYHYTPESTKKPLTLRFIRKPKMPSISVADQSMIDETPPHVDPKIDILKEHTSTAESELSALENSCQELRKYLTNETYNLPTKQGQNTLRRVESKDNPIDSNEMETKAKNNENQTSMENVPQELNLKSIFTSELEKIHFRLDDFFRRLDQNRCDVIKINSKIEDLTKKLNYFCTESNATIKIVDREQEEKGDAMIENERLNELVKNKRAGNEGVNQNSGKNSTKRKRNRSEGDKEEDIPKKISTCKFALPKDYDRNDSRWTLKYREMDTGLVELIENTGIYVNETSLSTCKRLSKHSKEFAQFLLLEIFSVSALSTCTLTGAKASWCKMEDYEVRPGLDKKARMVLLATVERHARENRWARLHTRCEIKRYRQNIMSSLRNKMVQMRKLNKLFCKSDDTLSRLTGPSNQQSSHQKPRDFPRTTE